MNKPIFLPCPWCGGENIKTEHSYDNECYHVWCVSCKACGPYKLQPALTYQEQLEDAILRWNTRHEQATTKES